MCKGNLVCFDCRIALRRETWKNIAEVMPESIGGISKTICPQCRQPCHYLGPQIAIPKKRDESAWKKLRAAVMKRRLADYSKSIQNAVRRKHDLERRILEIDRRPNNEGRQSMVKRMKRKLENL